jgi:hypothetical protein
MKGCSLLVLRATSGRFWKVEDRDGWATLGATTPVLGAGLT